MELDYTGLTPKLEQIIRAFEFTQIELAVYRDRGYAQGRGVGQPEADRCALACDASFLGRGGQAWLTWLSFQLQSTTLAKDSQSCLSAHGAKSWVRHPTWPCVPVPPPAGVCCMRRSQHTDVRITQWPATVTWRQPSTACSMKS